VKRGVSDKSLVDHLYIIDTHLMILEDEMLVRDTIEIIEKERINAEAALHRTINQQVQECFQRYRGRVPARAVKRYRVDRRAGPL
ncbi:MAG: hypothetical protein GWN87_32990, partial [Desulfuromonadales bacterium]|nr:hypothetical protein [Desulfuromonadales bacterium]